MGLMKSLALWKKPFSKVVVHSAAKEKKKKKRGIGVLTVFKSMIKDETRENFKQLREYAAIYAFNSIVREDTTLGKIFNGPLREYLKSKGYVGFKYVPKDYYLPSLRCVREDEKQGMLLQFMIYDHSVLTLYHTNGFLSFFNDKKDTVLFKPYKVSIGCDPGSIKAYMETRWILKVFIPTATTDAEVPTCFEIPVANSEAALLLPAEQEPASAKGREQDSQDQPLKEVNGSKEQLRKQIRVHGELETLNAAGENKNVKKALITAAYVGVEVKLAENFQMGVSNMAPEFLKVNPIGKVPALETPQGHIFESNAVARSIAYQSFLLGSSKIEYDQIEQWIDFSTCEIDAHVRGWLYPRMGFGTYIKPAEENSIAGLKRGFDALNKYLASHTFLVGDGVTLADIITTCNLLLAFQHLTPKSFTSEYPHVEKYFWTMVNQPNFRKVIGEVKQAEAVVPIASAKKPEAKPKPEPNEEVKKEEAPKPAVQATEEEEAIKEPAVQATEEEEAPKPKPKNPLDLLPPSKMVLDDWKRLYSNTKTNFREVAIKGFWDMYDPEGYSLWFCDYKYNDENTISLVTMNKVGEFMQRMVLARKYAFGKMLITGNEPPFKVKGLWLFRGQEIPKFVMDECYDMELYEWTKVDLSDEAQKERVNQMIEDKKPFEGEALLDAKCFK